MKSGKNSSPLSFFIHLDSNQFSFQAQLFSIIRQKLIKLNFDGSLTFYREGFESRGGNYSRLFIRINGDDGRIEKESKRASVRFCFRLHP